MAEKEAKGTGGKRVASSGGKGKRTVVIVGVTAAVLAAAYLALCAFAARDVVWPHTAVLGMDVSGLSFARAEEEAGEALSRQCENRAISFTALADGEKKTVATLDAQSLMEPVNVAARLSEAQSGFFTGGARYLGRVFGQSSQLPPELRFTAGGELRMTAVEASISGQLGVVDSDTTWTVTDDALVLTKGRTGVHLDREALRSGVEDVLNGVGLSDEVAVSLEEQAPPAEPDFNAIRAALFTEAADAYLNKETGEIVPSVTGMDLDVAGAKAALERTAEGEECRFPLTLIEPEMTTETLSENLFKDVLGEAVTRVTGTADRKMNVKVAAAFLDGVILDPGEEFSFNKVCSPYTVENGYGKATAYVNGLSKDTVAGGICQASSTLYWASLKANLETVERYAHRYEPSYIKGGLDATVYGNYGTDGSLDFRFKNSTDYPVKLESYVDENNYIHVTITGTDTTGIHGEPYSTNRTVTQAAQTVYEAKADVPQGTTQPDPERTAYDGVTWETYQLLVDADGNEVETKYLYKTKYYVRNAVIWYNPADMELWGIDPATGLQTAPPAESELPVESAEPVPGESLSPVESEVPVVPPAESLPADPDEPLLPPESVTTPPAASQEPAPPPESIPSDNPVLTPPPDPSAEPSATPAP